MNAVTSLQDRRSARERSNAPAGGVVACSGCGSEWFDLVGPDGEPPAVTRDIDGRITGYAGTFACRNCGRADS